MRLRQRPSTATTRGSSRAGRAFARPAALIDLNPLRELDYVRAGDDGGLRIGALTRHRTLEREAIVARLAPLLAEAVPNVAHGWLRLHGLASLPLDPATQVRGACACADNEETANNAAATGAASTNFIMAHS